MSRATSSPTAEMARRKAASCARGSRHPRGLRRIGLPRISLRQISLRRRARKRLLQQRDAGVRLVQRKLQVSLTDFRLGLDLRERGGAPAKFGHVARARGLQGLLRLFDAPALGGELRAQLIPFGDDFVHRQGHEHFQPAPRQAHRAPPESRQEKKRQEPRDEKAEGEHHRLFDHTRRQVKWTMSKHGMRRRRKQSCAAHFARCGGHKSNLRYIRRGSRSTFP